MHFLRGAGLAGLRGMLPDIQLSALTLHPNDVSGLPARPSPRLIRPLLEITRPEIEAYCREHQLSPRQDFSNLDMTFYRNRLRRELIPHLETYNPNIRQLLRRAAKVIAAEVEILNRHLDEVWPQIIKSRSPEKIEFHLGRWLKLPLALKRSSLRRAVHLLRRSLRDIGFEHIENAVDILERGGTGAKATLPQGLILTKSYRTFTITAEEASRRPDDFSGPCLCHG